MSNLPSLRVSDDRRILETVDGKPFFYLADTAWELFHRLTRHEAGLYLRVRAVQGFNAIQAVALAEEDGLRVPNREGHLPLIDLDPTKPNEPYWELVDHVIDLAGSLGLYTALLPTWGDKWNAKWGKGPEIFTPQNARAYGEWIARRYQNRPIIWVMGGDRSIESDNHRLIIRAMAEGVRSVIGSSQLMTFHPPGGRSSSPFVHEESWLDFNMLQSGHTGFDAPNWQMIAHDRALAPTKPVLDGEPCYENHPVMRVVGGKWTPNGQWFKEHHVRKAAWRAALSGACGHTYGCHDIWQFYDPRHVEAKNFARTNWREAVELPGATQMRHVKQWMEQIGLYARLEAAPMAKGVADLSPAETPVCGRAADGQFAMIYLPCPGQYAFDLSSLESAHRCTLISPVTGDVIEQRSIDPGVFEIEHEDGLDVVLLIE